jgi:Chaperone of endosialidase
MMKLRTQFFAKVLIALAVTVGVAGAAVAQVFTTWCDGPGSCSANTGNNNSAFGFDALTNNTTAAGNTAVGTYALTNNTTGSNNNASGYQALFSNTTGIDNNAMGVAALSSNTTGSYNNAVGYDALFGNTTGIQNNASGYISLLANTTGNYNAGYGAYSLTANTTGAGNNGIGYGALYRNTTGGYNTANGFFALGFNTTGANNIAVGPFAGYNLTTGSNNIDIGNRGIAAETAVIRIGIQGTNRTTYVAGISGVNVTGGAAVVVNSSGQLGVVSSSRRYKEDIRSMGNSSDRLLALRPVTFRYKQPDEKGQKPEQYGLIAEEVAQVMPELVVYNQKGQPETVAYQTLTPLLLNAFKREHEQVLSLTRRIESQSELLQSMAKRLTELESSRTELAEVHPASSEN